MDGSRVAALSPALAADSSCRGLRRLLGGLTRSGRLDRPGLEQTDPTPQAPRHRRKCTGEGVATICCLCEGGHMSFCRDEYHESQSCFDACQAANPQGGYSAAFHSRPGISYTCAAAPAITCTATCL